MRTRIITSLAAATLLIAACGGSSGSQSEVADLLLESADAEGLDLDKGCVEDVAGKLSDDDAEKMVEAGVDGEAELSPEGEALAFEMFSCVNTDALVDSFIAEMGEENVDADCMKDALDNLDPAVLAEGDLPDSVFQCFNLGG